MSEINKMVYRWAWFALGAVAVAGWLWTTRYEPLDENATFIWDNWTHTLKTLAADSTGRISVVPLR